MMWSAAVAGLFCLATLLRADLLYFTQFKSHEIIAFDTATGKTVATLAVEDNTGIAGIAPSRDGSRLYVVDGDSRHRLREFDTVNWRVLREEPFEHRLLIFGTRNPVAISGDGRTVWVFTLNSREHKAEEIRHYDTRTHRWEPNGIRVECGNPAVASGANGNWLIACPNQVLIPPAGKRTTSIRQPADAVSCASGGYVLDQAVDGQPWLLERITPKGSKVDLRKLGMRPDQRLPVSVACAPSGPNLALANGKEVWIADPAKAKVVRRFALPAAAASGLVFSKDGKSIFALRREPAAGRIVLMRIDAVSGAVSESTVRESTGSTPFVWKAGPAQ